MAQYVWPYNPQDYPQGPWVYPTRGIGIDRWEHPTFPGGPFPPRPWSDWQTRSLSPGDMTAAAGAAPASAPTSIDGVTTITVVIHGQLHPQREQEILGNIALALTNGATRGCDGIHIDARVVDICIGRRT